MLHIPVKLFHSMGFLDRKIVCVSIIVTAGLFVPIAYIHEIGHALICELDGHDVTIVIKNGIASQVLCQGTPSNSMFYYAFGGLLGMFASFSLLIPWKWTIRNKGVLVGAFTNATIHGVTAIVETFAHDWYVTDISAASIVTGVPVGLAFSIFLIIFGRKRE